MTTQNAISKTASNNQDQRPSEYGPTHNETMSALWVVLVDTYGSKFTREYGETPLPTWAKVLAPFSANCMAEACESWRRKGKGWPPNLDDLETACRAIVRREQMRDYKQLAHDTKSTDKAKISKLLKGLLTNLSAARDAPKKEAKKKSEDMPVKDLTDKKIEALRALGELAERSN